MKKIFTIIIITLLFSACGNNEVVDNDTKESAEVKNGNVDENKNAEEEIVLTYWYWADNIEYSALMQSIISEFNETNSKNITVIGEEYPWDGGAYSETLFTAAMGGGGPDMAAWKLTSTPLFAANNLLSNLRMDSGMTRSCGFLGSGISPSVMK